VEALNNDPLTAHEVQPAITVAALVRADEHDLLNDIGKEGVMNDVKTWIDAHLPKG